MADDIIQGVTVKGYVSREEKYIEYPEGRKQVGTKVTFPSGASIYLSKKSEQTNKERGAQVSGDTSSVTCSNIDTFELKGTSGKRDMFFINGCTGDVNVAQDRDLKESDNDVVIIKSSTSNTSDVNVSANSGDKINRQNIAEPLFVGNIKSE